MKVQRETRISPLRRRGHTGSTDPRRRFRNRLLIGMVGVALLPLLVFAVLAVVELDAVSRSTAQATQSAILQDQQTNQESNVTSSAKLLDARADEIHTGLVGLAGKLRASLAATPAATPLPGGFNAIGGGQYLGGAADPSTMAIAGATTTDGRFATATAQVLPLMSALRQSYPEIAAVWAMDTRSRAIRTVPGFDVGAASENGRFDLVAPRLRDGADVFAASLQRMSVSAPGWDDPDASIALNPAQYWTDPYALLGTGITGVSVWLPIDPNTTVGADILLPGLVDSALAGSPSEAFPPGAYPMLLSSSGVVLYAGPGIEQDFRVPSDPVGAGLHATGDHAFDAKLSASAAQGNPLILQATLAKVAKDVFTAPVFSGHWMWARTVPVSALEPDLTSLTLGVTESIHRLFPVMVLPVLLLLVGLAFAAATLLSRRMELPVRALTDHAVLEERTRLAREIHDTLAQQLTGIVLELEAAGALVERGSERARHSVEVARNLARSALQEARRSVWNLRPAPLAATGVIAAISQEVESWQERTGIAARFRARSVLPRPALQPAAEVALLRIVQEALTNVARHSSATTVDVGLRGSEGDIVLTVRDDGVGFDPVNGSPRSDCFGLEGMRERAHHAGGTLSVVSVPGAGTTVTARVPLSEPGTVADTA